MDVKVNVDCSNENWPLNQENLYQILDAENIAISKDLEVYDNRWKKEWT